MLPLLQGQSTAIPAIPAIPVITVIPARTRYSKSCLHSLKRTRYVFLRIGL